MRVFISWSGTASRSVAEALADWLPKVIQGVEPFVSAKDIDKGANWTVELAHQLENAEFGIVCLAPDNLLSPWLNYEAGAITKSVSSRVCPVLFGVDKAEVKPPMAQLQMTAIDQGDFELLVASINKAAGGPVAAESVLEAVGVWWPKLQEKIAAISIPKAPTSGETPVAEPAKPVVDVSEVMEEILHRIREVDQRVRRMEHNPSSRIARTAELASDKLSPSVRALMTASLHAGLDPKSASNSHSSIDVAVSSELPEILPLELYDLALSISRVERVDVRISGPNRQAVFLRGGETAEEPF